MKCVISFQAHEYRKIAVYLLYAPHTLMTGRHVNCSLTVCYVSVLQTSYIVSLSEQ